MPITVPRNDSQGDHLQPSAERPIRMKSTTVYRNYRAKLV